ncbi:MAG: nickel pincer cofactor biosynthesis protein LarB [Armatimonadetes bacterium]|nr:nickel pincer cofactor biosynthesis protein LarB [Armatimonadota bacterium]
MEREALEQLLEGVRLGEMSVEEALQRLRELPFEDLGYAKVDHHRALRKSFPEVIFCQGKAPEHVIGIVKSIRARSSIVLATRATRELYAAVAAEVPEAVYHEQARIIQVGEAKPDPASTGTVLVISAGTADIAVAEEAAVTAQAAGCAVERLYDVGVAGIHRLLAHRRALDEARVLIVVAGMEGALASVVGGLVDKPVIAVPTSVGYGASFNGLAALLGMLNSCASGLVVVNIDNGFGAGYFAAMLTKM